MSSSSLPKHALRATGQGPKIISIPLPVSNAYLIRGARSVLVDAGVPGNSRAILKKLAREGISPQDISLLLLTHGHVDHFGSAWELKEQFGIPVAVHHLDADNLRRGRNSELHATGWGGQLLKPIFQNQTAHPLEPDILLDGERSLEEFGVEARILSTPGHTPGSISIVLPTQEWITGDLISGWPPFQRRPGYHLYAEDLEQVHQSIKLMLQQKPRSIFPGHGGPFEPAAVQRRFSRKIDFGASM